MGRLNVRNCSTWNESANEGYSLTYVAYLGCPKDPYVSDLEQHMNRVRTSVRFAFGSDVTVVQSPFADTIFADQNACAADVNHAADESQEPARECGPAIVSAGAA